MTCRGCGASGTRRLLTLGPQAVPRFPRSDDLTPTVRPALDLVQCTSCELVQLTETVDRDQLFGAYYWYRSAVNERMRSELRDIVTYAEVQARGVTSDDVWIDIGANDGTLLRTVGKRCRRIAFEPALFDLAKLSEQHLRWFPAEAAALDDGIAKVITSVAMFYDVDQPGAFIAEIRRLLRPDGVWIVQFQDLLQMMQALAFDNICHEHVCYYALSTFERLLEPHDLMVTDVLTNNINGGSSRITVQHCGAREPRTAVAAQRRHEQEELQAAIIRFSYRVPSITREVRETVHKALRRGPVDLYGASTKGLTLLAACSLDSKDIRRAIERSPEKIGRYYGNTGIPIVGEADGRRVGNLAPSWIVPIWQFRDQVIQREHAYLELGGQMIFPLPTVRTVTRSVAA